MRAIVHIVKRDGPVRKRVGYLANKAVLLGDWLGNGVALNAERLMEGHHGKGRATRHVVLSLEQGGDLPDSHLAVVAEKFTATFAPGVAWLGAVDRNTKAVHIHLLLCNSDGQRTLNFSPEVLKRMQAVSVWTDGIMQDGRRGAVLAKLTTAQQLKEMTHEQIEQQIRTGTLTIGRCNRKGEITSVILSGRRVRLSTVQRFALGCRDERRDATNRDACLSSPRLDDGMETQRKQDPLAARGRRNRANRKRRMEPATPAKQRPAKAPDSTLRGESPDVLFSHRQTLPATGATLGGVCPLARNPDMGGRVR